MPLESLKRTPPAPTTVPPSPPSIKKDIRRQPIRIESQEQKERRLAEERAKGGESREKSRPSEASVRVNEDAARREMEEHERREAEERKAKEEAERTEKERKEAEERAALEEKERKEAEERAVRQEAERKEAEALAAREAREEQEKERLRLEAEARALREALEVAEKERAEQGRLRKLQEEEEARAKEEAERQRKAEEDAVEASADAQGLADDAEPTSPPEEGEVEDDVSQPAVATEGLSSANKGAPALPSSPAPHVLVELPAKPSDKEALRIDTSLPSPEHQRKRPGPLNLQATINSNIAPPLPSALATARHIEDINRITYPQGIKSPRLELNVNTQKGKFRYVLNPHVLVHLLLTKFHRRYDRDFLLQFMNICKEKPEHLPPLDVIGLEPTDTSHTMSRGGSGRNRATSSMSMPANARSASIGLRFHTRLYGQECWQWVPDGSVFNLGEQDVERGTVSRLQWRPFCVCQWWTTR